VVDLVKAASTADIGVIPYIPTCQNLFFCLPNKMFEYMMAGLAIVSTDLPEVRKIVLDHDLGVIFHHPEDPRSIAQAINELLKDETRLKEMKRNALQAAKAFYNWESESLKLLKAYESLAHTR
jgi:glycosyltransferase involved in cell wall biosynthesis